MSRWHRMLLLTLALLLAVPAVAQDLERADAWPQRKWTDGLVLGPTYATVSGNFVQSANYRWGIAAGVFGAYAFDRNLSVRFDMLYVNRGATDFVTVDQDTISELRLGYLSIPATFGWRNRLTKNIDFGLSAGLALAFRINSSLLMEGASESVPDSRTTPGGQINSVEWSFPLGAGIGFYLPDTRGAIVLDARYTLGISRLLDESEGDLYNRSWEFTIRYALKH